ncbi:hypothetical protein WN944_023588 [Citrus x changshan-huyou]|uniref:Uncharacterized protein n=1 Tax=Citrus x changshan-huyou TaxID=2935761 RepID=A0AAP0N4G7_9ROSI
MASGPVSESISSRTRMISISKQIAQAATTWANGDKKIEMLMVILKLYLKTIFGFPSKFGKILRPVLSIDEDFENAVLDTLIRISLLLEPRSSEMDCTGWTGCCDMVGHTQNDTIFLDNPYTKKEIEEEIYREIGGFLLSEQYKENQCQPPKENEILTTQSSKTHTTVIPKRSRFSRILTMLCALFVNSLPLSHCGCLYTWLLDLSLSLPVDCIHQGFIPSIASITASSR